MKKNLFKVLFGLSIFAIGLNVHAAKAPAVGGVTLDNLENGEGSTYGTVVVGDVATPVYTVAFVWDDLTFDWTYDKATEEFDWKPASLCERDYEMEGYEEEFDDKLANGEIYTNATCTEKTNVRTEEGIYYSVYDRDTSYVYIEDLSENGKIVPSIRWNSTSNYNYTDATFTVSDETCISVDREDVYDAVLEFGTGLYSDNTCSTKTTGTGFVAGKYYAVVRKDNVKLTTEEIPDSVRTSGAGSGTYIEDLGLSIGTPYGDEFTYFVEISLSAKEEPSTAPIAGETIGTITISIRAK